MKDRARVWFREHHSLILWLSALLLAVGSSLLTVAIYVAIPVMLAAVGVGIGGERMRDADQNDRATLNHRVEALTREVKAVTESQAIAAKGSVDAIENWLQAIGVWAALDSEARVSLYELGKDGWRRLARFSTNLSYMNSGRVVLPTGQGAVHQAYLIGEYVVDNLPSHTTSPDDYYAEQRKLGITKAVCRDFTMRTRSYSCFAFGADGDRSRPYALVFESTDPNGLDSDALKLIAHSEARRGLVSLARLVPSPKGGALELGSQSLE